MAMRKALMVLLGLALAMPAAAAEKKYGPGVTDTEIKIGQTMPYSGPASAYGTIGRSEAAYFAMINDQGGINGRKINLISLDDGYSPPKTVEQVRRLVESDNVLAIFNPLGTAANSAIQKYLNVKKVPQLFLSSGSSRFNDPEHFPWTMPWLPSYAAEGRSAIEFIMKQRPNAKIAVLYQNDDLGKDYLRGIHEALGDKAKSVIVAEKSYEVTDPTVDSTIITLMDSGADTFVNISIPKFAAQAIRKAYDIGWKPYQFVASIGSSISSVMVPAGVERSTGIITGAYVRDPTDPTAQKTKEFADWVAFMKKYYPDGDLKDLNNVIGYSIAQTFVQVLKQAGDNLTRENIMKEAANLRELVLPMVAPGLVINTGPKDYQPLEATRFMRFDGEHWVLLDD
jgi:ABC-type branched-subunit amino acid transport system substrate-binding protein